MIKMYVLKLLNEWQTVDPDQMTHFAVSDLSLHCLLRPVCPNTYGYYGNMYRQ